MKMIDVPAIALAGIVVAIVMTARRRRQARRAIFRDFAEMTGRRYLATDDGTAETLSDGFEAFAVFFSPSLGKKPASPVVIGPRSGENPELRHEELWVITPRRAGDLGRGPGQRAHPLTLHPDR